MSTENAAPEEIPILERLQRMLAGSDEVLKLPAIPIGQAMMTINMFRAQLSKIYGKDAPELRHFPLMTKDVHARDVRSELVGRETPRLCRGGSRSLTFPAVLPRDARRLDREMI